MTIFTFFFSLFWLQILNLPALLQNKNTRLGPFPWKRSVLQNPDRERTNQSAQICHWFLTLVFPYNNVDSWALYGLVLCLIVNIYNIQTPAIKMKYHPSVILQFAHIFFLNLNCMHTVANSHISAGNNFSYLKGPVSSQTFNTKGHIRKLVEHN